MGTDKRNRSQGGYAKSKQLPLVYGVGLYRDVNLIVTNKDLFFPRHPLFIRTQGNKEVKIKAEIINQQKVAKGQTAAKMPVGVRILDADGKVVAEQKNDIHFNAKWRDREYELPSISLENAKLWSPDSPYLYTAEVTLYDSEGNIADQIKGSLVYVLSKSFRRRACW